MGDESSISRIAGGSGQRPAWRGSAVLALVVSFATAAQSQNGPRPIGQRYAPAYYSGTQAEPPRIVVFPPVGAPVVVPLPIPDLLRYSAFTKDGREVFASIHTMVPFGVPAYTTRLGPPRLIRIDLGPARVTKVADLVGLADVLGLVVTPRQDKILFAGAGWKGNLGCDLFEIDPTGQNMKMVLRGFGCSVGGVSPDGSKMLVPRAVGLDIVDLATGTSTPLGSGFWKGDWSPDGKWIAALGNGLTTDRARPRGSRTFLIDANDLSRKRLLGGESDNQISWSPDSRYLLYSEWKPPCPNRGEDPSLITMDIETGKREIVRGSRCNVNSSYVGWISLDALGETR
jgi:hypothetical protein